MKRLRGCGRCLLLSEMVMMMQMSVCIQQHGKVQCVCVQDRTEAQGQVLACSACVRVRAWGPFTQHWMCSTASARGMHKKELLLHAWPHVARRQPGNCTHPHLLLVVLGSAAAAAAAPAG